MVNLRAAKSQLDTTAFIDVAQAKGRPMLTWVGKAAPERVPVLPAQCIETFEPVGCDSSPAVNALYHGDNKEILAHLLANGLRGKVRLIYIDPPFDSGADYVRQVRLHGSSHRRMAGQDYSLGEQVQYTDIWANDNYLQFMYERLPLLRELLAPNGSLWLHCDHRKAHHLRMLLEEVFGPENYLNTIAWRSQVARGAKVNAFYFPYSTHWIEIFAKDRSAPPVWHAPTKKRYLTEAEAAQQYMRDEHGFFRTSDPGSYSFAKLVELHNAGRLYAPYGGEIVIDTAHKQIYGSNGGSIAIKYYLSAEPNGSYSTEQVIDNLWDDIPGLATTPAEEVGYPTQKTEALLTRIIEASTDPGDIVLDCFMGSGTTVAVAQRLNRRWIGCDINHGSIQTASRRLQRLITTQLQAEKDNPTGEQGKETTVIPISEWATFALYRINGYDLSLENYGPNGNTQPTQAAMIQLAADVVGVRRIRTDPFFEGKIGERFVKFAEFSRPLLVADLEAIATEVAARPTMMQNIVVICLGRELATEEWLARWNQHRTRGQATLSVELGLQKPVDQQAEQRNHIEVIELYSDSRYGYFFIHEPAQAALTIRRDPVATDTIEIVIEEYISPTVIQRLYQQSRVEPPTITDWRAMVESVAVDPHYNGKLFRAVCADVPHKRTDVVQGNYRLSGIACPTTVAVKIIDMLGEELLITKQVE